ncbi:DUF3617 domain-containing protein [Novosphingobium colocasiae]|uniref:DUF3617 domain-containing protein n=1 Tax=Novosphingobium colocasiae TaxID=1256513 RepID=UPI001E5CE88D|nr:hypothetical protein [Novosphingobium colocasiae]
MSDRSFPEQKAVWNKRLTSAIAGAAALVVGASAAYAGSALGMLDRLQPGAWELRERTAGAPSVTSVCIDGGRKLVQLRHPGLACSTLVIDDNPTDVTVQYTCRGQGYGRTHIRRETDTLIQIDSQGIANGLPFAFAAEARRIGRCGT